MSAVPTTLTRRLLVSVETVTPDDARRYLELNENPRKIRPAKVRLYARDMTSGSWEVGTSSIKFDVQGRLRDGQHRLTACVEADRDFTTVVFRNVTDAAVDNTDRGMVRAWADVLAGRGYANAHHLQAAVTVGWRWDRNGWSGRLQPSVTELDEWLGDNSALPEHVTTASLLGHKLGARRSSVAAFMNRAATIDPDELERFVEALRSGTGLEATNPAFRLRERWMLNRHVKPSSSLVLQLVDLAYTCKAWNAWIEGRSINQLVYRWSSNERFPDLVDANGVVVEFPDVVARKAARAV